ncbi:MAG: hypothetical protein AB1689_14655 [Thermodesulfobacteriota bacterium]
MSWFRSEEDRVADELQTLQAEYRRLARQLESHVEVAPYPQVGERLQRLLEGEERNARTVAERLAALGRHPRENGIERIRGGRNAWERLVVMLEDYRALLRRLSSLWVRWDDEHPQDAALVRALRDSATEHREAIVDLIARSDPHAVN